MDNETWYADYRRGVEAEYAERAKPVSFNVAKAADGSFYVARVTVNPGFEAWAATQWPGAKIQVVAP